MVNNCQKRAARTTLPQTRQHNRAPLHRYLCITQCVAPSAGQRRLSVGDHWAPPDVQTGGTRRWSHARRLRFCGQFELVLHHRGRRSHVPRRPAVRWGWRLQAADFRGTQEIVDTVPPCRTIPRESNQEKRIGVRRLIWYFLK